MIDFLVKCLAAAGSAPGPDTIAASLVCSFLLFAAPLHGQKKPDKREQPPRARIFRDKTSKLPSLIVKTSGPWSLYRGRCPETMDYSKPVAQGKGAGAFPLDTETVHACFALKTGGKTLFLAERQLPMSGGHNFRDLGGIRAAGGRPVLWGKFFRADELHRLTEEDLGYLASIPLISVVDFRTRDESALSADKIPASVKQVYRYPITPGNISPERMGSIMKKKGPEAIMIDIYGNLAENEKISEIYRNFFALLQNEKELPLLYHCTAGKDRTGVATALLLFALGADEESVMDDYLASNAYLKEKYGEIIAQYPEQEALLTVKRLYLETYLQKLTERHGSVENYLTQVLKADPEKMRRTYLRREAE